MARVSLYSPELAERILSELVSGKTLREVCRGDGMPPESSVREWAVKDLDGFGDKYRTAREIGYLSMADELLEIADDATNDWMVRQNSDGQTVVVPDKEAIQRSRLRVDTRKWLLAKTLPKIYGERIVAEHVGKDGGPIQSETKSDGDLAKALVAVLHRGGKQD